jgi:hypothetical protein
MQVVVKEEEDDEALKDVIVAPKLEELGKWLDLAATLRASIIWRWQRQHFPRCSTSMGAVVTVDCSRDLGGNSSLVTSNNGHVADPHQD